MNKIIKLTKFFQQNASLVLNLNPIQQYNTPEETRSKTEEHEKQIAEFVDHFVNRVLPLYDGRLIIAVFDTGRLLTDSIEKNKDFSSIFESDK